jgi:uncharacterized protein (DUF362 family)/Pyruvate/2-oxoacid:ferredoxin oxidoreductase delta subunit
VTPSVVLARCDHYGACEVEQAVTRALSGALGADESLLGGKRVLLKPNLAAAKEPARCLTTHPQVVAAAVGFFRQRGCEVSVGDSPAGALRGVRRVWEATGMMAACESAGAGLVNFEAGGWIEKSVEGRVYRMAREALAYDLMVSLPKFKTHVLTLVTGAVKNMFGCVPGLAKSSHHLANPRPAAMSRVIVDIFSLARPGLSLVDAVEAMEGNGPSSGRPRHLGLIAAGRDAVALDAVMSSVVGVEPLRVPTTREAARRGLGEAALRKIAVVGEAPEAFSVGDFEVPSNWRFSLVPGVLARLALRWFWVKPVVEPSRCVGCGDCERMCAAGAIRMSGGRAVVTPARCVSCICCIEACQSGAIEPRASRLARLVT